MMGYWGWSAGPWFGMWIIPVLVLGLILWMIFRGGHGVSEALDRRYANGEISREDYQRMKQEIKS
ncbi:SHOCT domain-containing protein [Thiomonas sp. 13-64-67]|uniref:SHOCT domain-containing protein n=1 Tax=Thiomonas sp. 13-64-67 TaxID=1970447 RepID=UPI000BC7EF41|nr:SHOCT domain-containing protein [Thiomonas sp. 13-64-67]OZB68898.1 MAG: hypothetical protein B7X30_14920 [Thiomonas sp. 13-64-67]